MTFEQFCDLHWGKNRSVRTDRQKELCEFAKQAWNAALDAGKEAMLSPTLEPCLPLDAGMVKRYDALRATP